MVIYMRLLSTWRRLIALSVFLLSLSCGVAPPPAPRPSAEEIDFRRIDTDPDLLRSYEDRDLARSLRKAEGAGVFQGGEGTGRRHRLNTLLATRCRQRYPAIPDPLWQRLQGADWIGLLMGQEGESGEATPEAAILPFRGARAFAEEDPDPAVFRTSYTMADGAVQLPEARLSVGGIPLVIPAVTYLLPGRGQELLQTAEKVLGNRYGQPVQLGAPLGSGRMRMVFRNPVDQGTIVKVYMPEQMQVIHANGGGFDFPVAVLTAVFLQRELAVQGFLLNLRQQYLDQGLKPPFDLASIDGAPELISRGIILQQKVKGMKVWKELPEHLTRERLANLNRFFKVHQLYDKKIFELLGTRYGVYLNLRVTEETKPRDIGIDWGERFSNFFLADDGTPILIDW